MNDVVTGLNRPAGFRSVVWGALVVLLFGAVGLAVRYAPPLHPEPAVAVAVADCDLAVKACRSTLPGGGTVGLAITPLPIPVMERLALEVDVQGLEATRVEVDFAGIDMNMGFNRFVLKHRGEGRFSGPGVLPVCTRDRMSWQATVYATTERGMVAVPFRFETVRP